MPSKTQIIPEHDYAHVMVVEHDNSQRPSDRATTVLQTYCDMMFVFASPKGIDMKLQTINNGLSEFDESYGFGSFDDYGQPYLNARNAATSNAATLHCLRVTADDATHAAGALVAHYRVSGVPEDPMPEVPIPSEVVLVPEHANVVASDDPITDPKNITIRVAGTDVAAEISVDNEAIFGDVTGNYVDLVLDISKLMELDPAKTYQVTQVNPALQLYMGKDEFIYEDNGTYVKKRTYPGSALQEGLAFLVGADSTIGISIVEYGVDESKIPEPEPEQPVISNDTDLGLSIADTEAKAVVSRDTATGTYTIKCTGECVSAVAHPELWGDISAINPYVDLTVQFPNLDPDKTYRIVQRNSALEHWSTDPRISQVGGVWTKSGTYKGSDLADGVAFFLSNSGTVQVMLYDEADFVNEATSTPLVDIAITDGYTYVAEHTPAPEPEQPAPGPIGDPMNVTVVSTLAFKDAGTSEMLRAKAGMQRVMRNTRIAMQADEGGDEPDAKQDPLMEVYFTFEAPQNPMLNEDSLGGLVEVNSEVDENGFTAVKLFEIGARGRGSYGNNLRFVINSYARGDKLSAYKNYNFVLYEIDKATLYQKEPFVVSFRPDAVSGTGETLFLDYLVGDPYQNSKYIRTWTNPHAIEELFAAYQQVMPSTTLTENTFDPITGTVFGSSLSKIPNFTVLTSESYMVSPTGASGIGLLGGDDGAFTIGRAGREEAMQRAYLKAYSGEIDEMIFSRKMYPTDIILDACYPPETKQAISDLTHRRKDTMTFYDLGTTFNTFAGLLEELADIEPFVSTRDESIEAYYGKVQDPATWKIIKVSSTYPLAYMYPNHFRSHGAKHVPLAGSSYGIMTTFINGSAYPVFDDDIHSKEMDQLAEVHVNYLKVNSLKQIVRGAQDTRQDADTNLSECSNVFILHDIRRDAVNLCEQYEYNFAESSDMQRFNKAAGLLAEKYAAAQVSSITATFDMTDWEAERGILHLYIEFVHKRIIKRAIVEIDINRGVVVV